MQHFLRKLLWFSLILVAYFSANTMVNYVIMVQTGPDVVNSRILVVGDSRTQKAIDPSLFDDAQNICQLAEPYIITYWKLKKVFSLIDPDTVLIGFSHNNISAYNDLKFSEERWAGEMFQRTYALGEYNTLYDIKVNQGELLRVLWRRFCVYPDVNHHQYIGRYTNSNNSDISDSSIVIERHYYEGGVQLGVSETAIAYLDSIVIICRDYQAVPVLVGSPVHPSYFRGIPTDIVEQFEILKGDLEERGVQVIDASLDFYPDSLYLNADHINEKGARIFTREVQEMLRY